MKSTESLKELLRDNGFKATSARLALLEVIYKADRPLSVEQIISRMGKKAPDTATLYRALKELKETGILKQVDLQHGHTHYEFADNEDHHHFVCTKCDRIENIDHGDLDDQIKRAVKKSKYFDEVREHYFELFGICKKCLKK